MNRQQFEAIMRQNIVGAAQALNYSGVSFADFENSRSNPQYWTMTDQGGFRIRKEVTPAEGIRDIFRNGRMYAFECATAMVIVLYKAVLDSIGDQQFNQLFANILLYDWHYDEDLRLIQVQGSHRAAPGDILYFINPDVSPETPEWKGENTIKLNDTMYYGHGMGILPAEEIIASLNRHRRPGSNRSAYLTENIVFPDFAYLSQFAPASNRIPPQWHAALQAMETGHGIFPSPHDTTAPAVTARVGRRRYIQ